VDSTRDRNQALQFEVGAKHVLLGLEVAVQRMSEGQLVEVTIPHLYGYGPRGHLPEIPPRSTLVFQLELVEILRKKRGRRR
jgi:FKBP-type peptidyl-prolyl cis-trans isomerase